MKERPILMSAPMVRAILEGRKTQTRRTLPSWLSPDLSRGKPAHAIAQCKHGRAGDRLWIKETVRWSSRDRRAFYAADDSPSVITEWPWQRDVLSAIFLPRGASRITLEIAEVRVQRLQEISEDDARAEGVKGPHLGRWTDGEGRLVPSEQEPPRPWAHSFAVAWQEINGKRASWWSNPWCWCLTFRRVEG